MGVIVGRGPRRARRRAGTLSLWPGRGGVFDFVSYFLIPVWKLKDGSGQHRPGRVMQGAGAGARTVGHKRGHGCAKGAGCGKA